MSNNSVGRGGQPAREPSPPRKRGTGRIGRSLISLSAAAIITVYGAGYFETQFAAPQVSAQTTQAETSSPPASGTLSAVGTVAPALGAPTQTSTATATAPAATAPAATAPAASSSVATLVGRATSTPAAAASGYQDGSYVGTGTSRHGNITAKVVVQGGKIISASITQSSTRYPTSAISALPGEVLAAQSTRVNYVSGATDSSSAYLTAVQNALAQAA